MNEKKRAARAYIFNSGVGAVKAFTLPEILVVVLLISVVTSAVYSFYELGARAHKSALGRLEAVSSMRFLQKLLSDKLSRKSENCYSAFLKKDGFAGLAKNQIENILTENMHAKNDPLYGAVGYAYYQSHSAGGITNITAAEAAGKLGAAASSMAKDFRGAYLYEATKEAAVAAGESFSFSFDRAPSKVIGSSFIGAGKSVVISTNASEATAELNVGNYIDLNPLIGSNPPVNISFSVNIKSGASSIANLFHVFFFFDSDAPPSVSLSANITS
ncbi:MAG TPA: prepilin-type N-terminal cleavage/methylation domain-containing protein, partial [Candidatus Wallbacteria bacterium]|nr:prepilin-type N-terminal cleavage/methylation domain-containing protein [Candidatus Wallbacteria bacterium]